jgi:hypothetical protein
MLALEELRAKRPRAVNDWTSWSREILRLSPDEPEEEKSRADRDIHEAEDKAWDDLGFLI